jgi:hypothetical protein
VHEEEILAYGGKRKKYHLQREGEGMVFGPIDPCCTHYL